jgi:hypothetical protein
VNCALGARPTSFDLRDRGSAGQSFARDGARLDDEEANRAYSLVAFDVWIAAIRLLSSFSGRQPDHIHSQPSGGRGTTFVLTAYLLLITEAIGTYVGVHFLWTANETPSKAVKT